LDPSSPLVLTYPLCAKVFISKPRVGLVFETSSPQSFFTIVVFPALSSPLCVARIVKVIIVLV